MRTLQDKADAIQEAKMLDMINKIQLFQIAGDKANHLLKYRKQTPVFSLSLQKQQQIQQQAQQKNIQMMHNEQRHSLGGAYGDAY